MSDEPSDAQKLIAETLRVHEVCFGGCDCGWRYPNDGTADHRGHVAVEVDKALGGLTRKRRIDYQWRETGEVHHDRFFEGKPVPKTRLHYVQQSRWVSGWTVTE